MNRTDIEWCRNPDGSKGYTINPVKGLCPVGCDYCYARRMYWRFKWNPEIRYIAPGFTIAEIKTIKSPSRIFWGSTIELFGPWIADQWIKDTLEIVRQFPQHTHIFLTKRPWELVKWNPWPDNAWVGVTHDGTEGSLRWSVELLMKVDAKVKFLSIEPLLRSIYGLHLLDGHIEWLIIGQQTPSSPRTAPKREWIDEIVMFADDAGIPIFEKNNLRPILGDNLRQEWPK